MTNAERIAKYLAEYGPRGVVVHSIPASSLWLVGFREAPDQWQFVLCRPEKVTYRLLQGPVSDAEHNQVWRELIMRGVGTQTR